MEQTYKKHAALRIYLISRWFYLHHMKPLAQLFYRINNVVFQCSIAYEADIHPSVRLCHARGVMIHPHVTIGEKTVIFHNISLGSKEIDKPVDIHIGKNCMIGVNSCVLGVVTVGDNSRIGANTVVFKDVPPNCNAVGVPAKIIEMK